jgi:dipeptidyl aminopeptidase/acylaminoacyl peptidase
MRSLLSVCVTIVLATHTAVAQQPVPWRAPASADPIVEERTFSNGDVRFGGTLHLPRANMPVPAIVVLHSASSPTRDLPLYRHLVQMLPPLGIAVFVYDRRGSGLSGGDLGSSDYALLADDAIAAQRMLAADPRIDRRRLGFWGLSQGGWLAMLAASRSASTAFVDRSCDGPWADPLRDG